MAVVFDDFNAPVAGQLGTPTGNSFPSSTPGANWTPASTRTIFSSIIPLLTYAVDINITNPGEITVVDSSTTVNFPFLVTYDFDSPQNLTNNLITLMGVPGFIPSSIFLRLVDNTTANDGNFATIMGNDFVSNTNDFSGIDQTNIVRIELLFPTIAHSDGETSTYRFSALTSALACLASDSLISMSDGTKKQIKDIQRGDLVLSHNNTINKVARVISNIYPENYNADILKFDIDSLGKDSPSSTLYISKNHPIVFEGKRKPAYCFEGKSGVTYYKNTHVGEVLKDRCLCDIQFETEGTYIANDLPVQSRSPYSDLTPLPLNLYFDESKYKDIRVWDSLNHELLLDLSIIN